jgi:hypothetical protein
MYWCFVSHLETQIRVGYTGNTLILFKLLKIETKIFLGKGYSYLLDGKGGRHVGLITLPLSFADCEDILGASTSWSPKGLCTAVDG